MTLFLKHTRCSSWLVFSLCLIASAIFSHFIGDNTGSSPNFGRTKELKRRRCLKKRGRFSLKRGRFSKKHGSFFQKRRRICFYHRIPLAPISQQNTEVAQNRVKFVDFKCKVFFCHDIPALLSRRVSLVRFCTWAKNADERTVVLLARLNFFSMLPKHQSRQAFSCAETWDKPCAGGASP